MVLRRSRANPGELTTIASAFTHWVVTTILIGYAVMPLVPWLKGALIGALSAAPVLITSNQSKPGSVLPIVGISIALGAAVGFMTAMHLREARSIDLWSISRLARRSRKHARQGQS
jgi:hypothetical protein